MALDALAVQKYSAKVLATLEDAHVFRMGTNQDYEGEIKKAASLVIYSEPEVTTSSYSRGGTITYAELNPGQQMLVIDQRQLWAIKQDSLEKALAMMDMFNRVTRRAAWQLADDVDDFIASAMQSATPSANQLTSRVIGLGLNANAYELLVDLAVTLRENNVPPTDLHAFISPAYEGFLKKDPRFSGFNTAEARRTIRGTPIGEIEGMEIHVSNNLATSGNNVTIQAAWKGAMTYGEQLEETRYIPVTAGDKYERMDGELVFGGKVTQPQGLAYCNVTFAA